MIHHNHQVWKLNALSLGGFGTLGGAEGACVACGACGVGTCRPPSDSARLAGSLVNELFLASQVNWPPVNFWVTLSPSVLWSATGTPSAPVAPPSLSHAAFIAPRTITAPWSAVAKMTGLSCAAKELIRLSGTPPSASGALGSPRLPVGPPAASYFSRMGPVTAYAPVAGLKKILPPANAWPRPSGSIVNCSPWRAPSGPVTPPAAR